MLSKRQTTWETAAKCEALAKESDDPQEREYYARIRDAWITLANRCEFIEFPDATALFSMLQIFHPFAHCYLSCHRTTPTGAAAIKGANMPNDVHETASAIAAFDATKVAFVALVKKAVLSKAEAEAILRKAIEAVKTEGAGEQAAELLSGILERLSNFQPTPRK
jgi:hypothetical protein